MQDKQKTAYRHCAAYVGDCAIYKIMLVMKLTMLLLTVSFLNVYASSHSQSITFSGTNMSLEKVLTAVEQQTGYVFFFKESNLKEVSVVTISAVEQPLELFLASLFSDRPIDYAIRNKTIILSRKMSSGFRGVSSAQPDIFVEQPPIRIKVTDVDGSPLAGATITVKKSKNTSVTDSDGVSTLDLAVGEIIIVSFVGYEPQIVTIKNAESLSIVLVIGDASLEEAVVNAGYYTVKDKERTGNIYKVSAKEIENQPVNNILDALQGRVPGLEISPTTGLAGGGYTVRIRGQNSIAAGNDPLFIIDGVPFDMTSLGSYASAGIFPEGNINPLNFLDPSNVESVEVLKDADATAIYGSRGANGVILIRTRKGIIGKSVYTVDFSSTILNTINNRKLLNTDQYIMVRREAYINDGYTEIPEWAYDINGTWDSTRHVDWQKTLIGNTGFNSNLKFNTSGGNEFLMFFLSGNIMKEKTVFPMDFKYRRVSFSSSISHKSKNNKLSFNLSTNYGGESNNLPAEDLTSISTKLPPNSPEIFHEDGSLNWANNTWDNPFAMLYSTYENSSKYLNSNINLSYHILKNLEFKTNLGYNTVSFNEINKIPHTILNPSYGASSENSLTYTSTNNRSSWILEPQLNSFFNIANGKLDLLVGASILEKNNEQDVIQGYGFVDNSLMNNISAANNINYLIESSSQYKYAAVYGRVNYNHNKKYIFNITTRRDGSSRYGPKSKYSNFGAIGAGWIISNENFLKNLDWLKFSKLRISYGISGNDQIGDYQYNDNYTILNNYYDNSLGFIPQRLYNPYYEWEKNRKFEVAYECSFWKDIMSFEIGFYRNISDNQLVGSPLPATTGFGSIFNNLNAVIENKGWEFVINSLIPNYGVFKWDFSIQITIPKNKVLEFEGLENSTYKNQLVLGKSLNIHRLYNYLSVNPQTGIYQFEDFNNDNQIDYVDRQYDIDLAPKYFGNLRNTIQYKKLKIDFNFQFIKKMGFNEFYYSFLPGAMVNLPQSILHQWKKQGDISDFQRFTTGDNGAALNAFNNFKNSNKVVSDASFVRLKSFSLAYSFSESTTGRGKYLISIEGQNLFTITNFQGGDPEQNYSYLPLQRRISIAFKMTL